MIEQQLIEYGMAGLFIGFLIYDRQTTLKGLIETIKNNTVALNKISLMMEMKKK